VTPDQIEAERVAFEAWRPEAKELRYGDSYWSELTKSRWEGWLARAELAHSEQQRKGHDATTKTQ
jgi:hypothetical protein